MAGAPGRRLREDVVSRGGAVRIAYAILSLASLAASWATRPALAQTGEGGAADSSAAPESTAAPADSLQPRKLLSTDGAIRVYAERKPGEGKNGFWWEYDPQPDLVRLLDKDRRERQLPKLTDAYGFEIFAPESIAALRDSVTAVADSILAANIQVSVAFDPKFSSRYVERKDQFDFTNELTSPVPISSQGTIDTRISDSNSFNESTRKVRDGRSLAATFNYRLRTGLTSSLALTRNNDQQRREETLESRSENTSLNARVVATRKTGLGDLTADVGIARNNQGYETTVTEGTSKQLSPSWHANFARGGETGKVSLDYVGHQDAGRRRETRTLPPPEEGGQPQVETSEQKDRNSGNKLDFAADRKLSTSWNGRVNGTYGTEKIQFIAPEDSLAGRQETRTNGTQVLRLHVDGKPMQGLELLVDTDRSRSLSDYELGTEKFQEIIGYGANSELRWDALKGGKVIVKLMRDHEDRNYRSAQAGFVDKESANLNWKQTVTPKVELTANYDISLDSYVFDDKVNNTGDRDLRTQRGVFTVRYNVSKILTAAVNMDLRHDETVNINAATSRNNKTDYTYVVTPNYSLNLGRANLNGDFGADARYAVYDFNEDQNFLTRRFFTQQRLQDALMEHVSLELIGRYEFQDEGSYRRSEADQIRRYAKSRETRRWFVSSQVLYSVQDWLRTRVLFRRDGEDQFTITQRLRVPSAEYRTDELTFGVTVNKKVMRSVRLDVDFDETEKRGDRVTDVDRHFYTIRASLEYQPFSRAEEGEDDS